MQSGKSAYEFVRGEFEQFLLASFFVVLHLEGYRSVRLVQLFDPVKTIASRSRTAHTSRTILLKNSAMQKMITQIDNFVSLIKS